MSDDHELDAEGQVIDEACLAEERRSRAAAYQSWLAEKALEKGEIAL